jgi:hypothetical protein
MPSHHSRTGNGREGRESLVVPQEKLCHSEPGAKPGEEPAILAIRMTAGCPISRVLCEKWGILTSSV